MDPKAAGRLYQSLLDAISFAFWSRDWDRLMPLVAIPNSVTAPDARREFHTAEEFLTAQRAARESYQRAGVTEYHRLCRSAQFADKDGLRISGKHDTFILRGGSLLVPVYRGEMTMACHDGVWQATGLTIEKKESHFPTIYADRL